MILNHQEAQITSQILRKVFNADIAPDQIKDIQIHDTEAAQTVVIVTPYALYTLGKDYFRQLVTELKPATAAKPAPKKPARQTQEVTLLNRSGANSIYQVIGETGNLYLVSYSYSTGQARCGCKAASFGRSCYHASAVNRAVQANTWQTANDELLTHLEEQAEAVAPKPKYQGYKTPAERGIPSLRYERTSDEEFRAETEKFLSGGRGVVVLADGTVGIDHEFYRLMGPASQLRGRGMRELRQKALFA